MFVKKQGISISALRPDGMYSEVFPKIKSLEQVLEFVKPYIAEIDEEVYFEIKVETRIYIIIPM